MKKKKKMYRFNYFIWNQWFKDISRRSKEIKDIKESYQIPAICVVKMIYFFKILYERGNIIKEKEKYVRRSLFY